MPQCCAVPTCSNKKGGHKFPKDKTRLQQWLVAIRREEYAPSIHSLVCKNHFSKDDYELPKDSVFVKPRPMLKKDAVPSKFSWNDPNTKFDFKYNRHKIKQSVARDIKKTEKPNEKNKDVFQNITCLPQLSDKTCQVNLLTKSTSIESTFTCNRYIHRQYCDAEIQVEIAPRLIPINASDIKLKSCKKKIYVDKSTATDCEQLDDVATIRNQMIKSEDFIEVPLIKTEPINDIG